MKLFSFGPSFFRIRILRSHFFLLLLFWLPSLPLVLIKPLYFDDWVWWWVVHTEGSSALFQYFYELGRPIIFFPSIFFYKNMGPYLGNISRVLTVSCYLLNALLIHQLLRQPQLTRRLSLVFPLLYLALPIYGCRALVCINFYDFGLFFFFASFLILSRTRLVALNFKVFVALIFQLLSTLLETVVFFEPIRIFWLARTVRNKQDLRKKIPMLLLFLFFPLLTVVSRLTFLKPFGHYKDYNGLVLSWPKISGRLNAHFSFYHYTTEEIFKLATVNGSLSLVVLLSGVFGYLVYRFTSIGKKTNEKNAFIHLFLSYALFYLAAIPYAMAQRQPSFGAYESRMAVLSLFAVILFISTAFCYSPLRKTSCLLLGVFLSVGFVASVQDVKWNIYDAFVQRDFFHALDPLLPSNLTKATRIHIEPSPMANGRLYRRRTTGWYDLAVPVLFLMGVPKNPVYLTVSEWGKVENCTITTLSGVPCPEISAVLKHEMNEAFNSVNQVSLFHLLKLLIFPRSQEVWSKLILVSGKLEPTEIRSESRAREWVKVIYDW